MNNQIIVSPLPLTLKLFVPSHFQNVAIGIGGDEREREGRVLFWSPQQWVGPKERMIPLKGREILENREI